MPSDALTCPSFSTTWWFVFVVHCLWGRGLLDHWHRKSTVSCDVSKGYTAAMIVEESRMLQVSIFQMLQQNLHRVDFRVLLVDVMAIADEVDSQLAQAMTGYFCEAATYSRLLEP